MMINSSAKGIYIHIPFCKDICYYCDFCKVKYDYLLASKYLTYLKKEFIQLDIKKDDIETIYIGGGTPSILDDNLLSDLFYFINAKQYPNLKEFTIEINPNDLNDKNLSLFIKSGVNRISIGVQSFNNDILKSINRTHNKNNIINCLQLLDKYNFTNINIDLILGFNNQSIDTIISDLEIIKHYDIKHISCYSLIIEDGTYFSNINYSKNEDVDIEVFVRNYLVEQLGYIHYEVSNYAKKGFESKHNLLYWNNQKYYGIGLGAVSYIDNYRCYNTKSITNYNKGLLNRKYEFYNNKNELLKDEIILKFRLFNGIDIIIINMFFNIDFCIFFEKAIKKNYNNLYIENDILYFTDNGKLFLNDIIIDFIEIIERSENNVE